MPQLFAICSALGLESRPDGLLGEAGLWADLQIVALIFMQMFANVLKTF